MSKIYTFIFILTFICSPSYGQDEVEDYSSLEGGSWYYGDIALSAGYGSIDFTGLTKKPTVGIFSFSLNFAVKIYNQISIGTTARFDLINQYSDLVAADGNYRGQRLIFYSPLLTYTSSFANFKFNYFIHGDYTLSKKTATNQELIYTGSSGYRISISFFDLLGLEIGPYYENFSYSKSSLDKVESSLTSDLKLSNFGLEGSLIF